MKKEDENKMYGYYISFEYQQEVFSFEFFGTNSTPVFGSAVLNFNKRIEEFTQEDYNQIKDMIASSLNEKENKIREKVKLEKKDKYTKEHIIIINILPKKYEVIQNEEREN